MQKLFEACRFEIASPSAFTLDLWHRSTSLPHERAFVHPHWNLVRKGEKLRNQPHEKMRVAFVGFPASHKGWPLFKEIVRRFGGDKRYEFFHFAAKHTQTLPGVTFVTTEVTSERRLATTQLLSKHDIDLLLLLSPWPETFSFVAHEAISAGAKIICLADSGNVADVVRDLGCGMIFSDPDEIMDFFQSISVEAYLSREGSVYTIEDFGTSATIQGLFNASERVQ
jgi:glycosyltransferase involved in cell wall biosynthesis